MFVHSIRSFEPDEPISLQRSASVSRGWCICTLTPPSTGRPTCTDGFEARDSDLARTDPLQYLSNRLSGVHILLSLDAISTYGFYISVAPRVIIRILLHGRIDGQRRHYQSGAGVVGELYTVELPQNLPQWLPPSPVQINGTATFSLLPRTPLDLWQLGLGENKLKTGGDTTKIASTSPDKMKGIPNEEDELMPANDNGEKETDKGNEKLADGSLALQNSHVGRMLATLFVEIQWPFTNFTQENKAVEIRHTKG
ncbi:hypothetical protein B0H14DRAFT_2622712 [Mycena olivaceomarginata]|nr:hypothetical protein B0H14DRAFT_2622712 [Mycena olivaceomarginata]